MNQELFAHIAHSVDHGAAPGCAVVLVPKGTTQIERFAYGRFAGPDSPAVDTQTVYDVASITKLFTAALVLRLHEQHSLSVFDRCGLYLENFEHSELQIIDLLTHQVNFGVGLAEYRAKFPDTYRLHEALVRLKPPAQRADSITYANLEFFYLGLIIENVTGHALHDELAVLFEYLGLQRTYTGPDIARLHIATPPTEVVDGQVIQGITHDETARILSGLAGHAGVFSSAEDLAMFGKAWLDGKIVSHTTLTQLVYKNYDPTYTMPQALGWWLRLSGVDHTISTPNTYLHTGFTGPLLAINPVTGKVAACTCNRTYYGRDTIEHRRIWELLVTWVSR